MTAVGLLARRSAHGLDAPADERPDWRRSAACIGRWDLFTGFLPKQVDVQARACHVCRHCDVSGQCEIFAALHYNADVVLAGKTWRNGRPELLPDPGCGPWCIEIRRSRRAS